METKKIAQEKLHYKWNENYKPAVIISNPPESRIKNLTSENEELKIVKERRKTPEEIEKTENMNIPNSWKPVLRKKKFLDNFIPDFKRMKIKNSQIKKLKKIPDRCLLITMLFANGTAKSYIISTEKGIFKLGGKEYIINCEESFFDLTLNMYHLYFHEDFVMPINREIVSTGKECFFSVTPENVTKFNQHKYVEKILTPDSTNALLKIIIIICAVTMLINIISFFLTHVKTK